jgi:hypothetical protein
LWVEASDYGLVNRLPIVFYVGLAFLGGVWYIGVKHHSFLPVALVLTVAYLYVAPALIRGPVWISNSYYPYGESLLINQNGHLIANPHASMVSYRYWPLYLYFASSFTMLTGLSTEVILKLFPLITVSMYALLSLLILRIKLNPPLAYIGSALVVASLFIRQQYFGPQAIAYIFFLATLLVTSMLFFDKKANKRLLTVLLFVLFVITTFTHPLTSFMSMAIFFAFYFAVRISDKNSPYRLNKLFLFGTVVWLVYNCYAATPFFNTAIAHFADIFSGSRGLTIANESSRLIGSNPMMLNFVSSWAIVGICTFVGVISILNLARKGTWRRPEGTFAVFNVLMLFLFAGFAFFGEYGAVEAYQRAFMFGLIPLSFLSVTLLRSKPKLLVVLLAGLMFLNIPAQYGADNYRLATPGLLSGYAFFTNYAPENCTIIGDFTLYIRYFDPLKNYTVLDVGLSSPFNDVPSPALLRYELRQSDYVVDSDLQHNLYMFYLGEDPMEQADFESMNRVFDDGSFRLMMNVEPAW